MAAITQPRAGWPYTGRRYGSFGGKVGNIPDFMLGTMRVYPHVSGTINVFPHVSGKVSVGPYLYGDIRVN